MNTSHGRGLSVRVERRLIRTAQNKNSSDAEEKLLEAHEALIFEVANTLLHDGASPSLEADLVQEGRIGLIGAVRGFDLSRTTRLSTYVWPTARGRMLNFLKAEAPDVEVSHLEDPLPGEKALRLMDTVENENDAFKASLRLLQEQRRRVVEAAADQQLSDQQREVMKLRYWQGMSWTQIADYLEVSRARISAVKQKMHGRLREALSPLKHELMETAA